ncbi:LacI family DNA-binding transcriptional regulator [Compostimonas suwonensis]|uniref:DNA-binding LacI/PurR family transcriptional regulator n=1 Tax=Compostimonas suwonensis TaxID=1048394 RepID=A0A2M9C531_9MICO|nr:LacI family DNA-binding transcriptional regulator [Compostimonas suwonensis]PJJ65641.1 DNA-binding LacI/PurR family transcriptional regulator [Compostimonas suwonensis]
MTSSRRSAEKPATIYDVAREAGVSHQTVSRFLLGYQGIRPATRRKVEEALETLDYRTNITARNLRNGRTGMVSLAIPSLNQPYFAELAQSVIHAAREVGLTVFVETMENDKERELAVLSGTRGNLVDGVLFAPTAMSVDDLSRLKIGFPIVLLGDRIFDSGFDHVAMANSEGARAAVEHLIGLGRRRIAVVGVEPPRNLGAAHLRFTGYRDALDAAGIEFDERLALGGGGWIKDDGVHAIERLIASGTPFDAVFGFNDALALGALRGLLRAGLRVPDDVAVVGFDDTQDALYSTPTLTSVAPGREEIARIAVGLMDRRLKGQSSAGGPQEFQADFHLVARESSLG